jgi:hypothetical protein
MWQHEVNMMGGTKQTCADLRYNFYPATHASVLWLSQGEAGALPPPPPKQGPRQLLAALVALFVCFFSKQQITLQVATSG